ncbi:MAG: hypothetical protein L0H83_11230, partial [Salinisphaera sp.]|nr:hypothetical protein [Salinisphaera sp.]
SILAQVAVVVIAAALAFTLVPNLRVFAEALLTGAGTPLPAINPRTVLLIALIVAALYLPVLMALWFAPPLVALGAQTVMTSLGASLAACARNTLPFLAYGLLAMPLLLLALLPLGLGLLIFIPVTGASLFAGYRDVFATDS